VRRIDIPAGVRLVAIFNRRGRKGRRGNNAVILSEAKDLLYVINGKPLRTDSRSFVAALLGMTIVFSAPSASSAVTMKVAALGLSTRKQGR